MNIRSGTVSKSKGNGKGNRSLQEERASDEPDSTSANDACPREQMIAEAAYFRAQERGFAPGNEMSDWLQAEADVEGLLGGRQ